MTTIVELLNEMRDSIREGSFKLSRKLTLRVLYFMLFVLHFCLIYEDFFPNLNRLNLWDEAAYISNGWRVFEHGLLQFSSNPLTAFFYAPFYLIFKGSPYWMLHLATAGRILLFIGLWFSAYLVSSQMPANWTPLVVAGFLIISPLLEKMLGFPSDMLFVSLASLSFWQLIQYQKQGRLWQLGLASGYLGLSALARSDGLILFVVLLASSFTIQKSRGSFVKTTAAALSPFLLVVGGYILLYGSGTGDFSLGTSQRVYDNFEVGQGIILESSGGVNPSVAAILEAREYFGTPEENEYSIIAAIRRNPGIYFERLVAIIKRLPGQAWNEYGKRFSAPLFILFAFGIRTLIRKREYSLLAMSIGWLSPILVGLPITYFRDGYLTFPFYIVLSLGAVGLLAVTKHFNQPSQRWLWTLSLLGMILVGFWSGEMTIVSSSTIFLSIPWLSYLATRQGILKESLLLPIALILLFASSLLLRRGYPGFGKREIGTDPAERAVKVLSENLTQGDVVAAGSPGVVWGARMTYLGLSSTDVPFEATADDFLDWLDIQGVVAVYVDQTLTVDNPRLWEKIQGYIGDEFAVVFSEDGISLLLRE